MPQPTERAARRALPPDLGTLHAVRRARDLMDRRYAEPLDLAALAVASGYSLHHFARVFRAAFGEPPATYLTRRRVERAMAMLRAAEPSVTEVCVRVGFASLGSFSSRFRELVGESPSAYRARHRAGPPPIPGCFLMSWTRPGTSISEKPGTPSGS